MKMKISSGLVLLGSSLFAQEAAGDYTCSAASDYPFTERSWGSCEPYTGTLCADYGITHGWVFEGSTMEAQEELLKVPHNLINTGAAIIGSSKCAFLWKQIYCLSHFPPCDPDAAIPAPKRICASECSSIEEECAEGFVRVEQVGYGQHLFSCDHTIANQATCAQFIYPNFFSEWAGTTVAVPDDSMETLTDPINGAVEVGCYSSTNEVLCKKKECPAMYFEDSRSMQDSRVESGPRDDSTCQDSPANAIDCDTCESTCQLQCPLQIWDEAEWNNQWFARWIPGFFSIPLNLLVMVTEIRKGGMFTKAKSGKRGGQKGNIWVFLCATLGVWYAIWDSLPTLALKFDMRCDGQMVYNAKVNEKGHPIALFTRMNVHFLQMLLGAVFVTLYTLYRKIHGAQNLKNYNQGTVSKIISLLYIFLIPFVLMIIHASLPIQDGHDNLFDDEGQVVEWNLMLRANQLRYAFAAGPRFSHPKWEWLLVTGPLMAYGIMIVLISSLLLAMVCQITGLTQTFTSGSKASSKGEKVSPFVLQLAKTMLLFAFVCVTTVALNLGTVLTFLVNSKTFSRELSVWGSCAGSGFDVKNCHGDVTKCERDEDLQNLTTTIRRCGEFSASAPSSALLVMLHLSWSLYPLFLGLLFSRQSLVALCQSLNKKTSVYASGGASTANSSVIPDKK